MARNSVYGVKHIAEVSGLSTATVSRVLNNHPGVSEKSRQRILAVMKKSQTPTRALHRPTHILVVVGSSIESYLTEIMTGIADYTHQHRATVEFAFDLKNRADLDFVRFIRERRCDGVLDLCFGSRPEELAEISRIGIPIMVIGEKIKLQDSGYIMIDSFDAAAKIVDYLTSLGHHQIFFLANGSDQQSDLFLRRCGYLNAIKQADITVHDRRVIEHIPNADTQLSGYLQTCQLLDESPEATAIIASTDEMAYGAMKACRERGLSIPRDISIVGFDDYRHSAYTNPGLTTMRQPLKDFGTKAMHHLDMYINDMTEELPKSTQQGRLIRRGSCAPPPKN